VLPNTCISWNLINSKAEYTGGAIY